MEYGVNFTSQKWENGTQEVEVLCKCSENSYFVEKMTWSNNGIDYLESAFDMVTDFSGLYSASSKSL